MFFIVFVLFFSKYFQVNSLKCMTNIDGTLLSPTKCKFDLHINDPIPTNNALTSPASTCAIHDADSKTPIGTVSGSCYGEVSIDYNKKTMTIELTHVPAAASMLSPYDDMFGFLSGIKSVVQYKINGNFEKEEIQMTTRIQCQTSDNCALDKLRKLISNLTIINARKNIFKELTNFLNPPDSTPPSELTCLNNDDAEVVCQDDENRCKFDLKKGDVGKGCAIDDPDEEFDLEYRFNLIQEIADSGTDNSAKSLKCIYLCKTDLCNSEDNFVQVDGLLNALAMGSESKGKSHTTNDKNSAAQGGKRKSDGHVTFYYRSMIIFFLFIQLLSN